MKTPLWRRPVWLLGHVIALVAVLLFVRAGLWQLDRLEEKKDRNRVIAERADGPAVDVLDVAAGDERYRHVTATGFFDHANETVLPLQSFQGTVGSHAVTPLVLADGRAVLVDRGWFPDDLGGTPSAPDGEVTVEGLLLESQPLRNGLQVARIQDGYDRELLPLWLLQTAPEPGADYPIRLPPPARDEGPHLSYAIQWFLFTGVVLVGYPVLLRKRIRAS